MSSSDKRVHFGLGAEKAIRVARDSLAQRHRADAEEGAGGSDFDGHGMMCAVDARRVGLAQACQENKSPPPCAGLEAEFADQSEFATARISGFCAIAGTV
jgi:hypothetical protein